MKKISLIIAVSVLICIGILLRITNITPFTVYPDSYQNLLVAENIANYGSVVGYLGTNGMLYPDFFMWTRPVYALLILGVSGLGIVNDLAARGIAFALGIAAIPLAYFFLQAIYREKQQSFFIALCGAALLAFSFNHAVWGGMIMTETTGVFFVLLFLLSFFNAVKQPPGYFKLQDILSGLLLSLAVFTRYEYSILLLPVIGYIFISSQRPNVFLLNFISSFLFGTAIFLISLYPVQSIFPIIFTQLRELLSVTGVMLTLFIVGILFLRLYAQQIRAAFDVKVPAYSIGILAAICIYITCQIFFPNKFPYFFDELSLFRRFFTHDVLISIFSFIGFILLFKTPKLTKYAFFALASLIMLVIIYHRINPEMERYLTHVLPFLLIPASYGLVQSILFIKKSRFPILYAVLIMLFLVQSYSTANGLRYLGDASWYRLSYEEQVARKIQSAVPKDAVLLVSTPEPYYYYFKQTTHSLADSPPYIYIPSDLDNRQVIIIEDMGMHDYFPTFTYLLHTKLQQYKKAEFFVQEKYHAGDKSVTSDGPVTLYEMTVHELKQAVQTGLVRNF